MNIDTTQTKELWLVKVPKYLATAWKDSQKNSELGRLQIPKNPNDPHKFIASLQKQQTLPTEHKLTLAPLINQGMVVLSHPHSSSSTKGSDTSQSESTQDPATFQGVVKLKGELRPAVDSKYISLKVNLKNKASEPVRRTQLTSENNYSYNPRNANLLAHEANAKKKSQETKKVREDKEVIQQRVFKAFEKQKHYNIKDLERITNQSIPYLKEILKEICNYTQKRWELKPEFRHYKDQPSGADNQ